MHCSLFQMKEPQDKRRWSFRKRSPRHRVLTNTVPSDLPPAAGNKESPEPSGNDFAGQASIPGLAKISIPRETDDIFPLSPVALRPIAACSDSVGNVSDIASRVPKSVVIVIQTAVRGCLARGELDKLKNVIKLQAAARGHLVRRQAAGALRCAQAIIRMQAVVRGHHVRSSVDGLAIQQKLDQMRRTDGRRVNKLENEEYRAESNSLCRPADKVFGSAFARQIYESTSMSKPVICDPTEPSSGWRWLERWMTLSAKRYPGSRDTQFMPDHWETTEKLDFVDEVDVSDGTAISHGLESLKAKDEKSDEGSMIHLEGDEDLITIDASGFTFHSCHSIEVSGEYTNTRSSPEHPKASAKGSDFKAKSSEHIRTAFQSMFDSLSSQPHSAPHPAAPDPVSSPPITGSFPSPPKTEVDVPMHSMKASVPQYQQAEGKKGVFVARKSMNPAFAAVQSKFEELSSMSALGRMGTSNNYGVPVGPSLGAISPRNSSVKSIEVSQADDTASCNERFQKGTSECGTEISISSTLDSPDISEAEGGELGHVSGALDNKCCEEHGTAMHELRSNHSVADSLTTSKSPSVLEEAKVVLMTSAGSPMSRMQNDSAESGNPVSELGMRTIRQMGGSSQEGSPTSRATVQESHGTPSSQVSSGTRKSKADSNKSISKRISSVTKGSPCSENHNPMEQNTVGPKAQRRRNSLGLVKPGHIDVEQRSNSLPNYMQATESARAKALASLSPKSSPDALDKDGYLNKRLSLPISNGKQDSPRIRQSLSQAQTGAKGSSDHSSKGTSAKPEIVQTSKVLQVHISPASLGIPL
ncbi:IQ-DOMAIN 32 protein [Nymphaea thermarum]|nr:IQ-DOMAIN 32 protein [Nymphaea thermarum]